MVCGILVHQPGMEPTAPCIWKHRVRTTGPQGEPNKFFFMASTLLQELQKFPRKWNTERKMVANIRTGDDSNSTLTIFVQITLKKRKEPLLTLKFSTFSLPALPVSPKHPVSIPGTPHSLTAPSNVSITQHFCSDFASPLGRKVETTTSVTVHKMESDEWSALLTKLHHQSIISARKH